MYKISHVLSYVIKYNGILYSVPLTLIFKYLSGVAGKPLAPPSPPTVVSNVAPVNNGSAISTLPVPFAVTVIFSFDRVPLISFCVKDNPSVCQKYHLNLVPNHQM